MSKNKWLKRLIALIVIAAAIACLIIFVIIPLYFTDNESTHPEPNVLHYEGKGEILTMETDELLFELDTSTTHFSVTQKSSGRVWTDVPENGASDPLAQTRQKSILQSNYIVQYKTQVGASDSLYSHNYAITNQNYTVEQNEDGSISVHYSIGRISRVYIIPEALPKDTFEYYKSLSNSKDWRKVSGSYTLYDAKKKADTDEDTLNALIAKYPKLEEEDLYILGENTNDNSKGNIESVLSGLGYDEETHEALKAEYFPELSDSAKCVFDIDVIYRLEGGDLVVEIPTGTILYEDAFPITSISVLPVFGAAGIDEDGFLLVPEGGGALIYNNNGKVWQNGYTSDLYGWDYAKIRTEAIQETRSDFGVFGMAKNGGSFLCFIESGSSFGKISADVSQKMSAPTSYNTVYAAYTILHTDEYSLDQEKQGTVVTYEKYLPDENIIQRYRFLETEDYVEMALSYGEYLREKGLINPNGDVPANSPVNVELVGAINKKVVKAGLPVDSVVATTSFEQAQTIIGELVSELGFDTMSVRLTGWSNGGVNQSVLSSVKPESALGGKESLHNLISEAKKYSVDLYLDGISCFAYDSNVFDGFVAYTDAARFVTREEVELYPYRPANYQQDEEKDSYYLVKPTLAQKYAGNLIDYVTESGAVGVAFRDIGMLLSADYNQKELVNREAVKRMNIQTLADAQSKGLKVMVKQGNDYALVGVDVITDMKLKGTDYSILDKLIPFYQIAIHGSVSYVSTPINLASDYVEQILTCAEYGAGLNFTFMWEDTKLLQDSVYSGYYAASYSKWRDDQIMFDMAAEYQKATAGLNSLRITGHEYLADDVTKTVYEDGTCVVVNYSQMDYQYDSLVVSARNYAVIRED